MDNGQISLTARMFNDSNIYGRTYLVLSALENEKKRLRLLAQSCANRVEFLHKLKSDLMSEARAVEQARKIVGVEVKKVQDEQETVDSMQWQIDSARQDPAVRSFLNRYKSDMRSYGPGLTQDTGTLSARVSPLMTANYRYNSSSASDKGSRIETFPHPQFLHHLVQLRPCFRQPRINPNRLQRLMHSSEWIRM
jgi:hypothetical protein